MVQKYDDGLRACQTLKVSVLKYRELHQFRSCGTHNLAMLRDRAVSVWGCNDQGWYYNSAEWNRKWRKEGRRIGSDNENW